MKLTCTVSRLANGRWLARHTGSSTGQVEVTDTVELQVRDEGVRP
jgi:hypothetical protein